MNIVEGFVLIMMITSWRSVIIILSNRLIYLELNIMSGNVVVMMFVTMNKCIAPKDLFKYYIIWYIMVRNFYVYPEKAPIRIYVIFVTKVYLTRIASIYYDYLTL